VQFKDIYASKEENIVVKESILERRRQKARYFRDYEK